MSDLINRQDAINALTEANLKRHMDSVEGGQENRSAIRIIMELPSAERKRGEWIKDRLCSTSGGTYGVRRCSVCEYYFQDLVNEYNFCPNCGADMRKILPKP